MSRRDAPPDEPPTRPGARTSASGTPLAVDVSGDRRSRATWAVLLVGPVIGLAHFMFVYLVAEAGCTGDGPGLRIFDPPVPDIVTLASTAVAAAACLGSAAWAHRRWRRSSARRGHEQPGGAPREHDLEGTTAFAGFLLSSLFLVMVLFVGVPTPLLAC